MSAPVGTAAERFVRSVRGISLGMTQASRVGADTRSKVRMALDQLGYRMLRVSHLGWGRVRRVRLRGGVTLAYRLNRGDILTVNETWLFETYSVPSKIEPGGALIDLGANIGVTGVYLAHRHRPAAYVGVEPSPDNAALAVENLARNDVPGRMIEAAIGPRDGVAYFEDSDVSSVGRLADEGREVRMVSMATVLDALDPDMRVSLLKMDIEGGEELLFDGDTGWLLRVDAIVAEVHPHLCDVRRMVAVLRASGFVERRIEGGTPSQEWYLALYERQPVAD